MERLFGCRWITLIVPSLALGLTLGACAAPFGLGTASTRALEAGVARSLDEQAGVAITGSYREGGATWSLDLQIGASGAKHITLTSATDRIEAILVGSDAYFRGARFASEHLGEDPPARDLAKAIGSSWWRGSVEKVPALPDLTQGSALRSTFLGPAATERVDHVSADGVDAVRMSGPRGEVFVSATPPYRLLRLKLKSGVVVDGIADADLHYSTGRDIRVSAPSRVVDPRDSATLPPMYSAVSVDPSRCGRPCVAAATVRNIGGRSAARAPSTVTFTASDPSDGRTLATCVASVAPDVDHNATTIVTCTMDALEPGRVTALLTATVDNPGAP